MKLQQNMKEVMAVLVLSLLISACSASISQQQAESIALGFIAQNVKFYTKSENTSSLVGEVNVPTATSYLEGDVWVVVAHITTSINQTEKKNDIVVKVDHRGRVREFNGQKLVNS